MEYPGARFTRPIRLAVLIIWITAFLVGAPLTVLYAAGYRFDATYGFFRETGGLSIDILPATAKIYLDNELVKKDLPIRLQNITPRDYHVRLSLDGYYDWEKTVTVKPRQTRYIKDITLIKQATPTEIATGTIHSLSQSLDGRYVLYIKNDLHPTLTIYDSKNARSTPLIEIPTTNTLKTSWSEKHNFFFTTPSPAPFTSIIVGNANNAKNTTRLISYTEPITKIVWQKSIEPLLYLSTSNTIFSFSPTLNEKRTIAKNTFLDWTIEDGTLWTLTKNTSTLRITKDALGFNEAFADVTTTSLQISDDIFSPTDWHIETIHNNTVLLQSNKDSRMVIVRQDSQHVLPTNTWLISPFDSWWILKNDAELWTYIEGEKPQLLTRSGEHLSQVLPLDEENTLGIVNGGAMWSLFSYELVQQKIVPGPIKEATANPYARQLYYTAENGLFVLDY